MIPRNAHKMHSVIVFSFVGRGRDRDVGRAIITLNYFHHHSKPKLWFLFASILVSAGGGGRALLHDAIVSDIQFRCSELLIKLC